MPKAETQRRFAPDAELQNRDGDKTPDLNQKAIEEMRKGFEGLQDALKTRKEPEAKPESRAPEAPAQATPPTPPPVPMVPLSAVQGEMERFSRQMLEAFDTRMAKADEKIGSIEIMVKDKGVDRQIRSGRSFAARLADAVRDAKSLHGDWERGIATYLMGAPSLVDVQRRDVMGPTELGGVVPVAYDSLTEWLHEEYGVASLIPRLTTTADTFRMPYEPEESGRGTVSTLINGAIDGDPTPKTDAVVDNSYGIEPGMWVTFVLTGGLETLQLASINHSTHTLTFASNAIDFDVPDNTRIVVSAAATVPEGGTYHEGYVKLTYRDVSLKNLPQSLGIENTRFWSDPNIEAWIQDVLQRRYMRALSYHILHGDATQDGQLAGFDNASGIGTHSWSAGTAGDTMVDAILRGIALIPGDYPVALAMKKADWLAINLEKDDEGRYIHTATMGRVAVTDGGPGRRMIGPHPVVLDEAVNTAYVYAFAPQMASRLIVNPNATGFAIGTIGNQFRDLQATALYVQRLAHGIRCPQAISKIYLNSAPS